MLPPGCIPLETREFTQNQHQECSTLTGCTIIQRESPNGLIQCPLSEEDTLCGFEGELFGKWKRGEAQHVLDINIAR